MKRAFKWAGLAVLLVGLGLVYWVLYAPIHDEGGGLTLKLLADRHTMIGVVRDFTTVFAVLLAFQSTALFGWSFAAPGQISTRAVCYGVGSALTSFAGLFWSLAAIEVAVLGGNDVPRWLPAVLMALLVVGTALVFFLIDTVLDDRARPQRSVGHAE